MEKVRISVHAFVFVYVCVWTQNKTHTHTHGEYGSCNLFDAFRDRERERTYRVNTKQENNIWVIKRVITTFGVLMRWVCGGCEREIL